MSDQDQAIVDFITERSYPGRIVRVGQEGPENVRKEDRIYGVGLGMRLTMPTRGPIISTKIALAGYVTEVLQELF